MSVDDDEDDDDTRLFLTPLGAVHIAFGEAPKEAHGAELLDIMAEHRMLSERWHDWWVTSGGSNSPTVAVRDPFEGE